MLPVCCASLHRFRSTNDPFTTVQFTLHNPVLLSIEGSRRAGGLISRRKFIKEQFQEVFSEYLAKRSDPVALEQCIRKHQAECHQVAEVRIDALINSSWTTADIAFLRHTIVLPKYAKAVGSWYAKHRTFCH